MDQTRQEDHGDQAGRNCKKTLNTAFISDPIISSKHLTMAAESYHEGAKPNQTKLIYAWESGIKFKFATQTNKRSI